MYILPYTSTYFHIHIHTRTYVYRVLLYTPRPSKSLSSVSGWLRSALTQIGNVLSLERDGPTGGLVESTPTRILMWHNSYPPHLLVPYTLLYIKLYSSYRCSGGKTQTTHIAKAFCNNHLNGSLSLGG